MDPAPATETRLLRTVLLTGATLNLVFWYAHTLLGPAGADPLWQRLVLSATCAGIAGMTWGPPALRRRTGIAVETLAWLGTWWWLHRVASV